MTNFDLETIGMNCKYEFSFLIQLVYLVPKSQFNEISSGLRYLVMKRKIVDL